jgi:diaminohydroxyphosphoribosylaminopyrimidine deaminase/5-amino-6-(5-phosphoribosylamino)uracil reductase
LTEHSTKDIAMTRRALELAARGVGLVSPSPLVGCVILSATGEIVGEGTYEYDGLTHAEVVALGQAGERAMGATAYVSLEPHSYHGRTPPCTDALVAAGIRRVVCPVEDPNPLVSGRGFDALRSAGVEVATGLFADEARRLNEKFHVWHHKVRPFVHLKLAMSIDGRISLRDSVSTALSGPESIRRVHEIRHEHDAILIGGNTALVDDPALTDRSGIRRRRPLVRIVLDNRLRLSPDSKLARSAREIPTILFSDNSNSERADKLRSAGVEVVNRDARDLGAVLGELRRRDLQSVLVEGGTAVAGAFNDAGLVDKYTFMIAPLVIGGDAPKAIGGIGAEGFENVVRLSAVTISPLGADLEITGYPGGREGGGE